MCMYMHTYMLSSPAKAISRGRSPAKSVKYYLYLYVYMYVYINMCIFANKGMYIYGHIYIYKLYVYTCEYIFMDIHAQLW
jgi:hypothetical protein